MTYFLAALPILTLIGLMVFLGWGGQRSAPFAYLVCMLSAILAFGLTPQAFLVSQGKAVFLALTVLAVLWPALLLYHLVNQANGIHAVAAALERAFGDRGLLLISAAWAFSSTMEGLAGFGLPIVVVSPMLVALGVSPRRAVAAVAIGHAWSVTFGDMGLIYQTLINLTGLDPAGLAVPTALLLGIACLLCGFGTALVLNQLRCWPAVLIMGGCMGLVQYLLATQGLPALASFTAGVSGIFCGLVLSHILRRSAQTQSQPTKAPPVLTSTLAIYGGLAGVMALTGLVQPLRSMLEPFGLGWNFPETITRTGFVTPSGLGPVFRVFLHPGLAITLAAGLGYWFFRRRGEAPPGALGTAFERTWQTSAGANVAILATIGLASIMEQTGMTQLLALGASQVMGNAYPLISPVIGILGTFATGSNNNSNILFAALQKNAAVYLGLDPNLLVAGQTAGGSIGSMLAPAKILIGCAAVGIPGKDGEIVRRMILLTFCIGLGLGLLTWLLV